MFFKQLMRSLVVVFLTLSTSIASEPASVFVDNVNGSDVLDGSQEAVSGTHGPVASLRRARSLLRPSGRLVLKNTGRPYRGEVQLVNFGGTAMSPLIVEGNGAVIEGIGPSQPSDWKDEGGGVISMPWAADWGFFVVVDGTARWAKSLKEIAPGESFGDYAAHRGYFRLPDGADRNSIVLEVPVIWSGVTIYDSSHIIIRNLHARFFLNDGFNFGGQSENLRFENIEASFNGDEGISAHQESSAYVTNGHFHHNDNGICDTGFSRTAYHQVSVHDNRAMGVWFIGGDHSLTDAKIWSNPTGILLEPSAPPAVPGGRDNPYLQCRAQFRNLWVKDGAYGLQILNDCSAAVQYATFVDQPIGIMLSSPTSRLHLINSIVHASSQSIQSKGIYTGDYNCWSNPKGTFGDRSMNLKDQFQQSKIEDHSIYADPGLDPEDSSRLRADSPAIGRAFVDAEHQAHMRRSHFVRPDAPPTVSQNMGADFARVQKEPQR